MNLNNLYDLDILENERISTTKRHLFSSLLISLGYQLIFILYINPPLYITILNVSLSVFYIIPFISSGSSLGRFLSYFIGCVQLTFAAFFFGSESGFYYLLLGELVAINFIFGNCDAKSQKNRFFSNLLTIIFFVTSALFRTQTSSYAVVITEQQILLLKIASILFCSYTIFTIIYFIFKDTTELEDNLLNEYDKNKNLLQSLLPKELIDEWNENPNTLLTNYHKNACIMFIRIADFKKITSDLSTKEKFCILNYLYTNFDKITNKYNLEKIKVVGNTYMVASGVPYYNDKYIENMFSAIFEIQEKMPQICKKIKLNIELKIGINAGSLASGVVGKTKFAYDIWGETVNTASRLCDVSRGGRIIVSKKMLNYCANYNSQKIGITLLKGLGEVEIHEVAK